MVTTIGIEPHRATHTAVAIDGSEIVLGEITIRADKDQTAKLIEWAGSVDVRQRTEQGELPDAHVIDLTVLEWRLAPSGASRSIDVSPDQRVILVCSGGFSSSLATARLQSLGVSGATDLEGGFKAWSAWNQQPQRGA